MNQVTECPFSIGDLIIYRPSQRGYDLDAMASPDGRLRPGEQYKVQEIEKEFYVIVEGYSHPGGGLYWTEFKRAD